MKRPTKAIIPAAGFGTRFLPQTKAMPKEMLPIIDKPIIQYVVEELVAAGIKDIIIVGNTSKRAIEDHFDLPNEDLLANLRAGGPKKQPYIDQIEAIAGMANFIYVRQKGPYGNATPLLSASHLIREDEAFIYKWADDFFVADESSTQQLIDTYEQYGGGVFACKKVVVDKEYDQYGIADGEVMDPATLKMSRIIEKPGKDNAPTDLASVSNYLLPGSIMNYVEEGVKHHTDGEFTFQPFVQQMIDAGQDFYAREIVGGTFCDTGDKLEYLKTVLDFGLAHEELGPALRAHLEDRLK
ncbi:MAG: sugar phosphate nucleotidyltransferase [Candidatus Saccharimonas sp.]